MISKLQTFLNLNFKTFVFYLSFILYFISIFQTAFLVDNDYMSSVSSLDCLTTGWISMICLDAGVSWIANVFIVLSWIFFYDKINLSLVFSLLAFIFSISFLCFNDIILGGSGHEDKIISYNAGFWLWCSSCLIMLVGNLFLRFYINKLNPN